MPETGQPVSLRTIIGNKPLFVTRWWGFRPDRWAGACFSSEAVVDHWMSECPDGGFVLGYASHHPQENVADEDKGRVFGVYEFVPEKIRYDDSSVIHPDYLKDPSLRRENGEFRWPHGLRAIRAWQYVERRMTGGTLPIARSLSFEATTNMVRIAPQDFELANGTLLEEVAVYGREFRPLVLRAPNAIPTSNYLLTCEDPQVLMRIPGWQPGEILFKPGIAFDTNKRCNFLNNHAIAKVFGLTLKQEYSEGAASYEAAATREDQMIARALELGCRRAGTDQQEFLLGQKQHLTSIFLAGRPRN
jgi:hypothetical protein